MNIKKAVVVGGSNGIGLAISKEFISRGYFVFILDIYEVDDSLLQYGDMFEYRYCDLLDFDEDIFKELAADEFVNALMITAGFGRVADFEYLHPAEIERLIKVNTIGSIKIVRFFYERIKSMEPFYCGLMGSIAGWVSSPMFSTYAASKAAICRFVESVNIELEVYGTFNRILNVSPGSIKGTRFNGAANNQTELTEGLAGNILDNLFGGNILFIPEYKETYRGVLERYNTDPHEFGISSYQYKKSSGRVFNERKVKVGYLSGTFDLFHIGHLNLLRRAKQYCDYLIVGVHPNAAHKGKEAFIPFDERMKIVGAIQYVDKVVPACPEDSDAWNIYHYDRLFVGSDYKCTERFRNYEEYFKDKGVEIMYLPYTQGTSSTQIRKTILKMTLDDSGDVIPK